MPTAAPLRARDLTVVRGPLTVLDGIDLVVAPGRRIGVVGPERRRQVDAPAGARRARAARAGAVERTPPTATVGYLPAGAVALGDGDGDGVPRPPDRGRRGDAASWTRRRRPWQREPAAPTTGTPRRSTAGWRSAAPTSTPGSARCGPTSGCAARLLDQPTASLSGGEAARAGLAALLLARFDVFLLDEPTNDLDLDGLDRLERWVDELPAAVVLVSHDRTFLARTITDVVELDEFTHRATAFGGGWQAFLDEREAARRAAWERFEEYDGERRALARRAQREREWATQGLSKVRQSDEPDKNIRAFKINQTEQLAGRAARTERAMERLEAVDKPREPWQLRFSVASAGRSGDVVARLDGARRRAGLVRRSVRSTWSVAAGERIADRRFQRVGQDDVARRHPRPPELTAGRRYLGPSVVVGEVEQARDRLDAAPSLLRAFQDATGMDAADVRTLLAKFGLVADHVTRPTATLSPGERTRATLALLMANGANVLVLDEPTNHLDLPGHRAARGGARHVRRHRPPRHPRPRLLERVRLTRRLELAAGRIVADDRL